MQLTRFPLITLNHLEDGPMKSFSNYEQFYRGVY